MVNYRGKASLLGIEDFEQSRRRIAREIGAILSTSSIMKTGLFVPPTDALDDAARHAPTYVTAMTANLGLIVNATRLMRTNFRPSARAIERPSDVFPTTGGPTKQRIGPLESS